MLFFDAICGTVKYNNYKIILFILEHLGNNDDDDDDDNDNDNNNKNNNLISHLVDP